MKKIGKREYDKAVKIVEAYQQQNIKTVPVACNINYFGFLWYSDNNVEHQTWIKAKNIDSACKKFVARKFKTLFRLDYEVCNNRTFIDISERKELKEWL